MPLPNATLVKVPTASLGCWRSSPPSDSPVLLHFHGNGELVHHWIPDFVPKIQTMGYEVFLAEYRGYGASTGTPQLGAMLGDVEAIVRSIDIPPEKIVVFGWSVGSIYAIEAVKQFPSISGLILESGIFNVLERLVLRLEPAELGCTIGELKAAVKQNLDHENKLATYENPLLVMHAEGDNLVRIEHAEMNYQSAGSKDKKLIRFKKGAHNSIMMENEEEYFLNLNEFLQKFTH